MSRKCYCDGKNIKAKCTGRDPKYYFYDMTSKKYLYACSEHIRKKEKYLYDDKCCIDGCYSVYSILFENNKYCFDHYFEITDNIENLNLKDSLNINIIESDIQIPENKKCQIKTKNCSSSMKIIWYNIENNQLKYSCSICKNGNYIKLTEKCSVEECYEKYNKIYEFDNKKYCDYHYYFGQIEVNDIQDIIEKKDNNEKEINENNNKKPTWEEKGKELANEDDYEDEENKIKTDKNINYTRPTWKEKGKELATDNEENEDDEENKKETDENVNHTRPTWEEKGKDLATNDEENKKENKKEDEIVIDEYGVKHILKNIICWHHTSQNTEHKICSRPNTSKPADHYYYSKDKLGNVLRYYSPNCKGRYKLKVNIPKKELTVEEKLEKQISNNISDKKIIFNTELEKHKNNILNLKDNLEDNIIYDFKNKTMHYIPNIKCHKGDTCESKNSKVSSKIYMYRLDKNNVISYACLNKYCKFQNSDKYKLTLIRNNQNLDILKCSMNYSVCVGNNTTSFWYRINSDNSIVYSCYKCKGNNSKSKTPDQS
ncbi:MAG: hypothetical protein KIT69_16340, partial [Propionibacteriaceae bacterium]|nr:hypothetical protein [Propionibacteriaceae bacterium]